MRVLYVFSSYEKLNHFVSANIDHCVVYNNKDLTINSPSGSIKFVVIVNEEDFLKIAGCEFSCAMWHYSPTPDIRRYVMSRLRYLK